MLKRRVLLAFAVFTASLVASIAPAAWAERADAPSTSTARTFAKQMVAGNWFTCSLSASGSVRCWGDNSYGQLGNGATNNLGETASVGVLGISNGVEIAAGAYHACALLADGRVKCWGYGLYGQLGHGSKGTPVTDDRPTPIYVQNSAGTGDLTGVTAIAAGYDYTCALMSNGGVKCWGATASGQLGNGVSSGSSSDWQSLPVDVKTNASTTLSGVVELSAGSWTACAVLADTSMKCWGSNSAGQLGIGNTTNSPYAVGFGSLTDVKAVTIGDTHTCAMTSSDIFCSGSDTNRYAIGLQLRQTSPVSLAVFVAVSGAKQVVASGNATCILKSDATVACAGGIFIFESSTTKGVNGTGSGPTSSFTTISGLTGAVGLVAGGEHFCASVTSGIKCWGRNQYGQLGNGAKVEVSGLVDVVGLEPATVTINDPGAKNVDSSPFDVSATSSSAAPVSLSIDSASAGVCSISGVRVTILGSGTCTINGISAASGVYSGGSASQSVTISSLAPGVSAGLASGVTMAGATLTAAVNAKGAESTVTFEIGTDASLASATSTSIAGSRTGIVAADASYVASGLVPGKTYYFRFVATNSQGTSRGAIASFVTLGDKPVVATGSASRASSGTTVNGKVNPKDLDTSIQFEYSTDPKLTKATLSPALTKSGNVDLDVSALLTGLEEKTTYYYRIIASNVVGSAQGDIKSFETTRAEGVSINNGDEFTSSQSVTVSVVGPSTAVKAILSNDGGFATSETFDLVNNAADIPWTLQSSKEGTFTKIVYVKYVSRFGSTSTPYTDDIILDTTKPVVSAATAAASTSSGDAVQVARVSLKASAKGGVKLSVRGSDTISGVGSVEVRSSAAKAATTITLKSIAGKADGKARPMSQTISLKSTAKRLQVRVIDRAGNASAWRSIIVK